ncbi:class I SAM-dependent methyltransferase [Metabacillus idriensis]|uniref:class I SAM-dependent methyltransferase n=1 Tax=Metabacillus idriensis TaxID=324768 RepID=UPI0017492AB0|nr:class I SAM-dependent methyltransferase [Metabacillus idriensis]
MPSYLDLLAQLGVGGAHPGGFLLTKEIIEREMVSESAVILDVGCGTGQTLQFLRLMNYDATGLDCDPTMLLKAKKRLNDDTCLIHGTAEKLPFKDSQFDLILCESVLSFTHSQQSLYEMHRVLKDHGVLLAIEVTRIDHPADEIQKKIQSFYGFRNLFTEYEWKSAFYQAGFKKTDIFTEEDYDIEEDEPTTEFDMSDDLDPIYFDMLAKHEELREAYQQTVQFRIFRGVK